MRVVSPLLAVEVGFGIAPDAAGRRLARAVLRFDALHRSPGLDQRAVDREVVARQQLLHLGLGQHRTQAPSSSRSRFFENTEWSQAGSSTPMPTNQRNRRSYSSRSITNRSERIE